MAPTVASLVASFTYEYIKSSKAVSLAYTNASCTRENDDQVTGREATFLPIELTDDDDDDDDEPSTSSHNRVSSEFVTHQTSESNSIHKRSRTHVSRIDDDGMLMTSNGNETCESDDQDDHHLPHADGDHRLHRQTRCDASVPREKLLHSSSLVSPLHEETTATIADAAAAPATRRTKASHASCETSKSFSASLRQMKKDTLQHTVKEQRASVNQCNKSTFDKLSYQSSGVSSSSSSFSSSSSSSSSSSPHTMTELKLISPSTTTVSFHTTSHITSTS